MACRQSYKVTCLFKILKLYSFKILIIGILVFLGMPSTGYAQVDTSRSQDTSVHQQLQASDSLSQSVKSDTTINKGYFNWVKWGRKPSFGPRISLALGQYRNNDLLSGDLQKSPTYYSKLDSQYWAQPQLRGSDTLILTKRGTGEVLQPYDPVFLFFSLGLEAILPLHQYFDLIVGSQASVHEVSGLFSNASLTVQVKNRPGKDSVLAAQNKIRKFGMSWTSWATGFRLIFPKEILSIDEDRPLDLTFSLYIPVQRAEFWVSGDSWIARGPEADTQKPVGGSVLLNPGMGIFSGYSISLGRTHINKKNFIIHTSLSYTTWKWENKKVRWNQIILQDVPGHISLSVNQIELLMSLQWGYPGLK